MKKIVFFVLLVMMSSLCFTQEINFNGRKWYNSGGTLSTTCNTMDELREICGLLNINIDSQPDRLINLVGSLYTPSSPPLLYSSYVNSGYIDQGRYFVEINSLPMGRFDERLFIINNMSTFVVIYTTTLDSLVYTYKSDKLVSLSITIE